MSEKTTGTAPVKKEPSWLSAWREATTLLASWLPAQRLGVYTGAPVDPERLLTQIFVAVHQRLEPLWRADIAAAEIRLEGFYEKSELRHHGAFGPSGDVDPKSAWVALPSLDGRPVPFFPVVLLDQIAEGSRARRVRLQRRAGEARGL